MRKTMRAGSTTRLFGCLALGAGAALVALGTMQAARAATPPAGGVAPATTMTAPVTKMAIAPLALTGWSATIDGTNIPGVVDIGDACPIGTPATTPVGQSPPSCKSFVVLKRVYAADGLLQGWSTSRNQVTLVAQDTTPSRGFDGGTTLITTTVTYVKATPVSLTLVTPDAGPTLEVLKFTYLTATRS